MASLSVDAKTFVPRSKSCKHRSVQSSLSADVPEFVPSAQNVVKQPKARGRFSRRKEENIQDSNVSAPFNLQGFQSSLDTKKNEEKKYPDVAEKKTISSCKVKSILKERNAVNKQVGLTTQKDSEIIPNSRDSQKIKEPTGSNKLCEQKEKKVMSWSAIVKQPPVQKTLPEHAIRKNLTDVRNKKCDEENSFHNKINKNTHFAGVMNAKQKDYSKVHFREIIKKEDLKSPSENPTKYTKRKLTRTKASFLSSSSTSDVLQLYSNNIKDEQIKNDIEEKRSDLLSMKKLIYSYKSNIEQGRDHYKVTKSKYKLLQKLEATTGLPDKEDISVEENVVANSMNPSENIPPKTHEAFPLLGGKEVAVYRHVPTYSAAVKKVFQKPPRLTNNDVDAVKNEEEEEEKRHLKKKQKVLNRRMKKRLKKEEKLKELKEVVGLEMNQSQTPVKQSEKDIKLDISDMFDQLLISAPIQHRRHSQKQKKVISTGVISVVSGLAKKNMPDGRKLQRKKLEKGQTILDGTNLIRKRGKERETPKKKKPTLLKKLIKAERERKRKLLEKQSIQDMEVSQSNENPQPSEKKDKDTAETIVPEDSNTNSRDNNIGEESSDKKRSVKQISPLSPLPAEIYQRLHSRKFREYCDHMLSKDINNLTQNLLNDLQKFQDRVYHENPIKYKQKRRFVLGLREVLKHMKVKKIKAVIIAPNLERISCEGGLDDYLSSILSLCKEHEIPQIFALNRHSLGRTLKKKAPVSIVGIFNYDGAQEIFKQLMECVHTARKIYNDKVTAILEAEYGHIPDISITTERDMTLEESIPNQTVESSCTVHTTTDAELIKQNIMNKFTVDEFRIVGEQL